MAGGLVLGDDHGVFADALETVLTQHGFTVLGVALTLAKMRELLGRHQPEVCVVDRHFADGDAVAGMRGLVAASPRTKVVVLTADQDPDGVVAALSAGAVGYVHKTRGVAALVATIRRVAAGEIVVDLLADRIAQHPASTEIRRLATYLTGRERQCLALLVEGLGTTAMAHRLGVSNTTVRTHVQALLNKLGVHSRLEAASLASRHSLLEPANRHRIGA